MIFGIILKNCMSINVKQQLIGHLKCNLFSKWLVAAIYRFHGIQDFVHILSHTIHMHQYTHIVVVFSGAFLSNWMNICQNLPNISKWCNIILLLSYENVAIPSCCLVVQNKFVASRFHRIMLSVFLSGKKCNFNVFLSLHFQF